MRNRCEQGLHSSCTAVGHRGVTGGHRGSPGGHRRRSSVGVPMCSYGQGSIRAASGTTLGVLGTSKMKENKRFYGFTDYRGKPASRGRVRRGTANQVTAGTVPHMLSRVCRKPLILKLCIQATLDFWTFEPPLQRPGPRGKHTHWGRAHTRTQRASTRKVSAQCAHG